MIVAGALAAGVAGASIANAAGDPFVFAERQTVDLGVEFYPAAIEVADLDLDGVPDLAIAGRNVDGVLAVLRGQPDGSFAAPELVEVGSQTTWVAAADFDGDADLDLLVSLRARPSGIGLLRNRGDGTFDPVERVPLLREPAVVRTDDLDGDGRPDALVTNYFGDELVVLEGTADGLPQVAQRIALHPGLASPARPYALVLADLDDDGDRDAAALHFASGHVAVVDNESDAAGPRFGTQRLRRAGTVSGVAAADRDGDGDVDLLLPQWGFPAGTLLILDNDGTGRFDAGAADSFGSYLWDAAAADFDGDGAPDVVCSDALEAGLFFLRNNGPDAGLPFGPAQFQFGFAFARHMVPFDVDGDCAIDLLVIDIASGRLTVLGNDTPQAPGGCGALDLDGDGLVGWGDAEVVLAHFGAVAHSSDVNRDGRTDVFDLIEVTARWMR